VGRRTSRRKLGQKRKIPPNTRSVTGRRQSQKNDRTVSVESGLEARFAAILEFDPRYHRYEEQYPIEYLDGAGKRQEAHPDFLAYFADDGQQPLLIDVKFRSEIFRDWKKLKPRFLAARRYALGRGWRYRILTEVEIDTTYTANAVWLLPYRRTSLPDGDALLVLSALRKMRYATPATLMQGCSTDEYRVGELLPTLWFLIATFAISMNLEEPVNMNSRIWVTE
jgi:hypothetical protein